MNLYDHINKVFALSAILYIIFVLSIIYGEHPPLTRETTDVGALQERQTLPVDQSNLSRPVRDGQERHSEQQRERILDVVLPMRVPEFHSACLPIDGGAISCMDSEGRVSRYIVK